VKLLARFFCITVLSLACVPAWGSVGSITEQDRQPSLIKRNTTELSGLLGTGIEMADTVENTVGKTVIQFVDNTLVEVNDHSRLEIDEFVYDPQTPQTAKLALNFAAGTIRYASGAIAHNDPNKVNINTPSASISVRGTDFAATVDEVGASTIILLPSCPPVYRDVEKDCKTGIIDVINDAATVTLNRPFEATHVFNRLDAPVHPVVLHLTSDAINNLLIVSPPAEITKTMAANKSHTASNIDDNLLDGNFLSDVFSLVGSYALQATTNSIPLEIDATSTDNSELHKILPDWKKQTGVVPHLATEDVSVCRLDSNQNVQCIAIPKSQNSTIVQSQGSANILNRVNVGANTYITVKQN
jgi:hypothetical protein